ncbi:hypothetical protein AMTR_s00005p00061460 [Amborella trichopoda]|uniref:Uncharacterized protein n=1 Tax=Amborella trichopoda TaxID=13333 RepID=W1PFL2_AMBTC|nr:hypothetical protein AMTR_s00005p00061460 [Amborella trichopoda]
MEHTLTLSSLDQGDFICIITEEGDIFEAEPEVTNDASAVTTSEVPVLAILEAEPQNFASLDTSLEVMIVPLSEAPLFTLAHVEVVSGPEAPLSTIAHVEVVSGPCTSSKGPSALTTQGPAVLAIPPPHHG